MVRNDAPIHHKSQLIDFFAAGVCPPADWRIGTEHEKFPVYQKSMARVGYSGAAGIEAILSKLAQAPWQAVRENTKIIGLKHPDGASITLEPGGQFELSGAPLENLHQTWAETDTHLRMVKQVAARFDVRFIGMGYDPQNAKTDLEWMPKARYGIMGPYMTKKGKLGQDMMLQTATVQTNLDYCDEADMVRKMRVATALQPLATAIFANSPFLHGKPSGYLSYRSHCWTDTDPDRCGLLPFIFETGFGYERWVDYLLDVPMYFVHRNGVNHNVAGRSFRDFMAGRLEGFEGELPTLGDWQDHMTVTFPEVRLKTFIEMRGADSGTTPFLTALPALWVGLLYDKQAISDAETIIAQWSVADLQAMRDIVPTLGFKTPVKGFKTMQKLAEITLEIAEKGLQRRARFNDKQESEAIYLAPLHQLVKDGQTHAEWLLDNYHNLWQEDIAQVFNATTL